LIGEKIVKNPEENNQNGCGAKLQPIYVLTDRTPSPDVLKIALALFKTRGDSLAAWCRRERISYHWARSVLRGDAVGTESGRLYKLITAHLAQTWLAS